MTNQSPDLQTVQLTRFRRSVSWDAQESLRHESNELSGIRRLPGTARFSILSSSEPSKALTPLEGASPTQACFLTFRSSMELTRISTLVGLTVRSRFCHVNRPGSLGSSDLSPNLEHQRFRAQRL